METCDKFKKILRRCTKTEFKWSFKFHVKRFTFNIVTYENNCYKCSAYAIKRLHSV